MRDKLGACKLRDSTDMVKVIVCKDHVSHRLVSDALDRCRKFVCEGGRRIDYDNAFFCDDKSSLYKSGDDDIAVLDGALQAVSFYRFSNRTCLGRQRKKLPLRLRI